MLVPAIWTVYRREQHGMPLQAYVICKDDCAWCSHLFPFKDVAEMHPYDHCPICWAWFYIYPSHFPLCEEGGNRFIVALGSRVSSAFFYSDLHISDPYELLALFTAAPASCPFPLSDMHIFLFPGTISIAIQPWKVVCLGVQHIPCFSLGKQSFSSGLFADSAVIYLVYWFLGTLLQSHILVSDFISFEILVVVMKFASDFDCMSSCFAFSLNEKI